jgi:hypothetical protein
MKTETTVILDSVGIKRALTRIAHEILERNKGIARPGPDRHPHRRHPPGPRTGRPSGGDRRSEGSRSAPWTSPSTGTTSAASPPACRWARPTSPSASKGRRVVSGGRRALYRPHHPRRHGRHDGPRPAPVHSTGGAHRPGPPGIADPRRFRRPQRADQPARKTIQVCFDDANRAVEVATLEKQ